MTRRQQALGIDGQRGGRIQGHGQGTGLGLGADAAAAEQQQWAFGVFQQGRRFADQRAIGRRALDARSGRQLHVLGRRGDDVQRQLDMHRAWPFALEHGEGAGQHAGQLLDAHQGMAEGRDAGGQCALVGQFVQIALAQAEAITLVDAGNHQHRDRVGIGLGHGGEDIGHARAGDDEAHPRLAGDAGIAVGHEAGTLFVARGDVADAAVRQAAVEFDGVHTGDTEHGVDAPGFELLD
ncbi:hypothetical protein D3C84_715650 [compost metagenome]